MKNVINNVKIELVTAICSVVGFVLIKLLNININMSSYFTQDRLNGIATFYAITIGVYIAVITVLAVSEIGLSKILLQKKLDKTLIAVIMLGIVENFITVGLAILIPMTEISMYLIVCLIGISMISFVKFIVAMYLVFAGNMEQMSLDIDEKERYKNQILTYLNEISIHFKKNDNQV